MKHFGTDTIFSIEKEGVPQVKACVMHPHKESVGNFNKEGNDYFGGIVYGLCEDCTQLLRESPGFQDHIDYEIEGRLNTLRKLGEQ